MENDRVVIQVEKYVTGHALYLAGSVGTVLQVYGAWAWVSFGDRKSDDRWGNGCWASFNELKAANIFDELVGTSVQLLPGYGLRVEKP
jgi:hypothetical protein